MALGELIVSIVGDMKELSTTLSQARNEIGNIGKDIEGVGKSLSSVGSSMTMGITAPIVATTAAIGGVSKEAMSFEKGMAQVFTLLPNASKASMGKMGEDVKNFSKEMGVTTTQVIPALYDAIGSGVPEDNVFSFLEVAQKGAVAGVTDIGVAVDTLTSITNAYGQENLKAAEASDILFTGINVGKMTYEELQRSLYEVVPTAASVGVQFSDITAALAAMTAQGTPTSVATAQLRQLLVELSKEGTGASETFKEIAGKSFPQFIKEGGTLQQAVNLLGEGFQKASPQAKELQEKIYELADPTSGLAMEFEALTGKSFKDFQREGGTAQQALEMMGLSFDDANGRISDMFGSIEAGNAILQLTGQGSSIFSDALKEMENSAGATDRAYAKMSETTSKSLDNIIARLQVAAVEMGEKFLPVIEDTLVPLITDTFIPALEAIIPIIGAVATAFNGLPQPIKIIILAIIAFIAALGPVLVAVGAVVEAVGTLAAAFGAGGALASAFAVAKTIIAGLVSTLGTLGAPILAIIAVVALLAVAWSQNWFDIQGKARAIWDWLKTQAQALWTGLQNTYNSIVNAGNTLRTQFSAAWESIKSVFTTIKSAIVSIAMNLYAELQARYSNIISSVQGLLNEWRAKWDSLKATTSTLLNNVISIVLSFYNNLQNKFSQIKAAVQALLSDWKSKWENLKSTASSLANQVVSTIQTFVSNLKNKFNEIKNAIQTLVENARRGFSDMVSTIKSKASDIVEAVRGIVTGIKNKATEFYNAGREVVQKLIDGLASRLTEVKNKVKEITNAASISASSLGNSVASTIKSTGQKAKVSLSEAASGLRRLLPSSPAKEGPFRKLPNWDVVFVDPLKSSIKKANQLSGPLYNALSNLRSPVDEYSTGFGRISTISNNTSYAGDTITIGPNTLTSELDLESIFEIINRKTAERRRARGFYR